MVIDFATAAGHARFAHTLASMQFMTDSDHAACPEGHRDLTALLHTLIEDHGMETGAVAQAAELPARVVAEYRALVGI